MAKKQDMVKIDTSAINQVAEQLKDMEKKMPSVAYNVIKRATDSTFTQVARIIPKHYTVKQKDVKATMTKDVSKRDLTGSITLKGRKLTLHHFKYTPKSDRRLKKKVLVPIDGRYKPMPKSPTVTVEIIKGQKVKMKRGFVATTGAKNEEKVQYNVFSRFRTGSRAMTSVRTLSIPQMVTNTKVEKEIQKNIQEVLAKRLDHEIGRVLDKG